MRSTVRIDDDLMEELKSRAAKEDISLTRMLNRTLRAGLAVPAVRRSKKRNVPPSFDMGPFLVDVTKANADGMDEWLAEKLRKMGIEPPDDMR